MLMRPYQACVVTADHHCGQLPPLRHAGLDPVRVGGGVVVEAMPCGAFLAAGLAGEHGRTKHRGRVASLVRQAAPQQVASP